MSFDTLEKITNLPRWRPWKFRSNISIILRLLSHKSVFKRGKNYKLEISLDGVKVNFNRIYRFFPIIQL